MSDLPTWVIELVDGLAEFDRCHPKLYAQYAGSSDWQPADCPCHLLDKVPTYTRTYVEGWRAGRDQAQLAATVEHCNEQVNYAMLAARTNPPPKPEVNPEGGAL